MASKAFRSSRVKNTMSLKSLVHSAFKMRLLNTHVTVHIAFNCDNLKGYVYFLIGLSSKNKGIKRLKKSRLKNKYHGIKVFKIIEFI